MNVREWIYMKSPRQRYPGPGAATAYEEGARARLLGRRFNSNPYARADCCRAWEDGYYSMDDALMKEKIVFTCPFCGRPINDIQESGGD